MGEWCWGGTEEGSVYTGRPFPRRGVGPGCPCRNGESSKSMSGSVFCVSVLRRIGVMASWGCMTGGARFGPGGYGAPGLNWGNWKPILPPCGPPERSDMSRAEKELTILVSYPRFCPFGPLKLGLTSLLAGEDGAEPPRRATFFQYS